MEAQIISSSCYIGFAFIVVLIDVPLLFLIYTHPILRKQKELIVMGFLCFADLVQAIAYMVSGAVRLWRIQGPGVVQISNQDCIYSVFPILYLYSYQLIGSATLAVSVDRILAVMFPFRYRKLTALYAQIFTGAIFIYITVVSVFSEVFVSLSPPRPSSSLCFTSEAYTPHITNYMLYFRICTILMSILLYIPIMHQVVKKSSAVRLTSDANAAYTKKMLRTTRTVGFTSLAGLLLVVIPDLILNFDLFGLLKFKIIWYTIEVLKSLLNIFLFTTRHDELRRVIRQTVQTISGALFSPKSTGYSSKPTIVTTRSKL